MLKLALEKSKVAEESVQYLFDIQPYYYQKEILEKLQAEREVHHRYKILLVAANGGRQSCFSSLTGRKFKTKPEHLLYDLTGA
jgi:hypothetical protein